MRVPAGGTLGTARMTAPRRPDIFYRYWRVSAPVTLLWLHGLGAHSGWFIDMGSNIAAQGVNFYAMDHQSFGRSGGPRGDIKDYHEFLTDIDRMVDVVKHDLPDTHLYVLGHSMGGIFATYYAASHGDKFNGVILLNPWVTDTTKISPMQLVTGLIGGLTGSNRVVHLAGGKSTEGMTTNPAADAFLKADPYWVWERTQRFYWQVMFLMKGKILQEAAKVAIPALVIQGEADTTLDQTASRALFDRLGSANKAWQTYSGYPHDPEFQTDRSQLDDGIAQWIKQQG
jgi:alpha-beta hydrolase superfamily lysophospholipase